MRATQQKGGLSWLDAVVKVGMQCGVGRPMHRNRCTVHTSRDRTSDCLTPFHSMFALLRAVRAACVSERAPLRLAIPTRFFARAMSTPTPPTNASATIQTATTVPRSPLACSTFLPRTPHFVTGHYIPPRTFLPDTTYAAALDTLTKVCNDLLLTHRDTFLIGRRNDYPQRSWWYACGGRTRPGETLAHSSVRLLTRELSLPLTVDAVRERMATVGCYSFVWEMRQQEPRHNGTADISVVTSMELTDEEKHAITHDTQEERRWVTAEHILSGEYHPALQRGVRDWLQWRLYAALDEAVMSGASESEVSKRASAYVRAMSENRRGDGLPVQASENYLPGDEEISKQRRQPQQ